MSKPISQMSYSELMDRLIELRSEISEIVSRIDRRIPLEDRLPRGRPIFGKTLSDLQRMEIGASYMAGEKVNVLARIYCVNACTIRRIVRRLGLPARSCHRPSLNGNGAC